MPAYLKREQRFHGTSAYEKLYAHFVYKTSEMPYGTAKFRDGDPVIWILDRITSATSEGRLDESEPVNQ